MTDMHETTSGPITLDSLPEGSRIWVFAANFLSFFSARL